MASAVALRRDHAERRRSSRRRAEGRRRTGACDGRERRRALPHPSPARERRRLCRSGPAAVCAESFRRAPPQGRARLAARHGRVSAGSVPFPVYASLMDSVLTGKPAADTALGMPVFEYLAKNPDYSKVFNEAMTALQRAGGRRGARGLRLQRDRPARGRGRRARRSADVDPEEAPERARRAHRRRPCHRRREAAHRGRRPGGPLPGRAVRFLRGGARRRRCVHHEAHHPRLGRCARDDDPEEHREGDGRASAGR